MTFCSISKQCLRQSHIFSSKGFSPCCAVKGLSLQLQIPFCNLNSFVFKLSFHCFIHLQHTPSNRMTTEKYVLNMSGLQTSKLTLPLYSAHLKRQMVMHILDAQLKNRKAWGVTAGQENCYSYRCRKIYNIRLQLPSYLTTLSEELLNTWKHDPV